MTNSDEPATTPRRIAVVGGGIAGLAAAHRLVELAGDRVRLALFEDRPRLGGVVWTVHEQGFQVEQSADNFITTVPWGLDLCRRLGLGDQLVQTNPAFRRTFVVRKGRLCPLPDGFLMMAPTRFWPLATTPILSPLGKLRAAMEYFIPPRTDEADESMAGFVRRRLGREVFDRLVEPLVSAVYAADLERLSVEATLSRFREMERRDGSLIRAMRRQMKARWAQAAASESGARYSMFVTLEGGLSSIVDAIAARLPEGAVRLQTPVERIEQAADGRWTLALGGKAAGTAETFDAIILATPSHVAARLLAPIDAELGELLGGIGHSGTAIVSVAFDRGQVAHPLDGMGVVIPAIEHSPVLAISLSSQKYPHRAPEGKVLLRAFVGGALHPEMVDLDDDELRGVVLGETARLLSTRGEPCYHTIARWPGTMPQYHVGHKERVARIRELVAGLAGLDLAGNAYQGVGIPDCIDTGQKAADRVVGDEPRRGERGA
jgi:oxygen-dependent protoporphyrinogen oxidase